MKLRQVRNALLAGVLGASTEVYAEDDMQLAAAELPPVPVEEVVSPEPRPDWSVMGHLDIGATVRDDDPFFRLEAKGRMNYMEHFFAAGRIQGDFRAEDEYRILGRSLIGVEAKLCDGKCTVRSIAVQRFGVRETPVSEGSITNLPNTELGLGASYNTGPLRWWADLTYPVGGHENVESSTPNLWVGVGYSEGDFHATATMRTPNGVVETKAIELEVGYKMLYLQFDTNDIDELDSAATNRVSVGLRFSF